MPSARQAGIDVNWEMVNEDALAWARQHSGQLVTNILDTTRDKIQRNVADFVENQRTIGQLRANIMESGAFNEARAQMIAVTETTASYAQGNMAAWRESDVVDGKEWNTNGDGLVCSICAPLDLNVVPLNGAFEGGHDSPPAHPGCRCWVTPVVMEDLERFGAPSAPGPGAPGLQPAGKPITDNNVAFDPFDEESKAAFADGTFDTIDSVHGDGELPRLRAKHEVLTGTDKDLVGVFERRVDWEGNIKPVDIKLNKSVQQTVGGKGSSLTHEMGHFLDSYGINKDGNFASRAARDAVQSGDDHVLGDWYKAVNNSDGVKRLQNMQANPSSFTQTYKSGGKTYRYTPSEKFIGYLQEPEELFARSYAQYIAESGSTDMAKAMLSEIQTSSTARTPMQWSTEDFAPIRREMNAAFKVLGWLT